MGMVEIRCFQVASRQHGVLSRAQARELGMSDRQVSRLTPSGRWKTLFPAVYAVVGAPSTWHQKLKAASLWAGRGFAVSHRAAAALHGFARFPEGDVELSITRELRPPPGVTVHRTSSLSRRDITSIEGLCVTSVARTLLDLCALGDQALLSASLDEALRRRKTTLDKLQVALSTAAYRRGVGVLRVLVDEHLGGTAPTESELEARVVELLGSAGLPRAVRQQTILVGGRVRRMDFRILGTPVIIEADGYAYHSSLQTFESDRLRNNELTARGFRVLHWTWAAVRDRPEELLSELVQTLVAAIPPQRATRGGGARPDRPAHP